MGQTPLFSIDSDNHSRKRLKGRLHLTCGRKKRGFLEREQMEAGSRTSINNSKPIVAFTRLSDFYYLVQWVESLKRPI